MSGLALCKLLERGEIAAHEGFLLRTIPSLEFSLVFNGIRNSVEPLREYQLYRPARLGVAAKRPSIVLSDPDLK